MRTCHLLQYFVYVSIIIVLQGDMFSFNMAPTALLAGIYITRYNVTKLVSEHMGDAVYCIIHPNQAIKCSYLHQGVKCTYCLLRLHVFINNVLFTV